MLVHELDVVELTDGRVVTVLDIYTSPNLAYGCEDVSMIEKTGDSNDVYFFVEPQKIKRVVVHYQKCSEHCAGTH